MQKTAQCIVLRIKLSKKGEKETMFKRLVRIAMTATIIFCSNYALSESGHDHTNAHSSSKVDGRVVIAKSKNEQPPKNPSGIKTFVLDVESFDLEILPDVKIMAWGFKLEGGKPSVPGPEIRVKEGDYVRVVLKNTHALPHTIHFHGADTPFDMDGAETTQAEGIPNGETFIYEFYAKIPGTHWYHCHYQTLSHLDRGMYGAFIVEPKKPETVQADNEVTLFLDEWRIGEDKDNIAVQNNWPYGYNYFTINGKAFPSAETITLKKGQTVKFRIINAGYLLHTMHIHGHKFLLTHSDGQELNSPYWKDTLSIGPGETYDVVMKADNDSGVWMLHDHVLPSASNNGQYPGGLTMLIKY